MRHPRTLRIVALLTMALSFAPGGRAALQNVQVGGEVRIRGNYWYNTFNGGLAPGVVRPVARIPGAFFGGRAIGDALGGQRPTSYYDWDSRGADYRLTEQRTVLNLQADFSDGVSTHVALESFDIWGEDFRSNYVTGVDGRAASVDDVEVYEAYMDVSDLFGSPLRLRVGRQELVLGRGWLVGNGDAQPEFRGLSFDGVRLTYVLDNLAVDAFWAKLAERSPVETDGDIDFYGIYGSYTGVNNLVLDAYWLFLRDARHIEDTPSVPLRNAVENLAGVDDYGVTRLHTLGARVAGTWGAFDLEAEVAYQFGQADQVGRLFRPFTYGDDGATFDALAATLELGYTLDMAWQPRFFAGGAYFEGEDNRGQSFGEWLNPLDKPKASISFNRLFSNVSYSYFLDDMAQLSNVWTLRAGLSASPTEQLALKAHVAWFGALETFDLPRPLIMFRGAPLGIVNPFTFITRNADDNLGWETNLAATYRYTDDLEVETGWSHLFTGDGLKDGNYVDLNGLLFNRGTDNQDADYLYWQFLVRF